MPINTAILTKEHLMLALESSNMNIWDWDVHTNKIIEYGHFAPLAYARPDDKEGSLEVFISKVHPFDKEKLMDAFDQCLENNVPFEMEYRAYITPDRFDWMSGRGNVVKDEQGTTVRMIGSVNIITRRKTAEEALKLHRTQQANVSQISYLNEITSVLAHELNQPLTSVKNYISGCVRRLEQTPSIKSESILDAMHHASKGISLAGDIVHRMKNFIRTGTTHCELHLIREEILGAISMIKYENSSYPVPFKFTYTHAINQLLCDNLQIQQVLLNLMRNAVESIKKSNVEKSLITIHLARENESHIKVNIHDNGGGIPKGSQNKLFAPYFTTKPNGMGMGLCISRSLIEAHGGHLVFKPQKKPGACFQFTLPLIVDAIK
ncbi:MAG TPA: hypothetical protein DDY37_00690 [Legionella sp.]|nr:hypothetical protein [Legionella sp.]